MTIRASCIVLCVLLAHCSPASRPSSPARDVLLITIDTLRADRVGAYGDAAARTPALDGIAREGARFDHAWATAPITLPSHASLLSGRYPAGHGSRHNGIAMADGVPTLATAFRAAGFATGAFVSAFPLDRRFGLARGFDTYDDELPRGPDGRPMNERAGSETVDRALAWLATHAGERSFLWVHLFEPHAPYGPPGAGGTAESRYAEEVAVADTQVARLLAGLGERTNTTLVVATGDHGEAFGEHGEIGHSIFIYDTTLRVPLVLRGPGIPAGVVVTGDVSLVDLAPTLTALAEVTPLVGDGQSLVGALSGGPLPARPLYAESFAPLYDFGWAALRSVRDGGWKYIDAPRPELYEVGTDGAEVANRIQDEPELVGNLAADVIRYSSGATPAAAPANPEAVARLRSLGYLGSTPAPGTQRRADPKDRIALAARLASVTSGEVTGEAMIATLNEVLREDPDNPQAHLRLGFAELDADRCDRALPHFRQSLASGIPTADAGLGLATCLGQAGDLAGAESALQAARRAEPGNPVVAANLGLLALEQGRLEPAIADLRTALQLDPALEPARFALARALARSGDRAGAAAEARRLLASLAADAPQRSEVERLLAAVQ